MGSRRRKGQGTVFQRADGYWVGRIEAGRGPDGRRRRPSVVRKRYDDVIDALDDLRGQVRQGVVPDRTRSVKTYLEWWLDEVIANDVSADTLRVYRYHVARAVAQVGHIRLGKLTTAHVQALSNHLARNYAPKTRSATLTTLGQALGWAVGAGMVARNPVDHVRAPRMTETKVDDALQAGEAKAVLAVAATAGPEGGPDRLYALGWLALKYGLRLGELVALRWPDIGDDEMTVAQSKTRAGERTLPLIADAKTVLAGHRRRQGVVPLDGYVFHRGDGQPLYANLVHDRWNAWLTKAGVAHICRNCSSAKRCSTSVRRFHVSRHTAATLLLEAGVPLEVVSAILGHANIGITADIYAKVRNDLKRKGLDRLG